MLTTVNYFRQSSTIVVWQGPKYASAFHVKKDLILNLMVWCLQKVTLSDIWLFFPTNINPHEGGIPQILQKIQIPFRFNYTVK